MKRWLNFTGFRSFCCLRFYEVLGNEVIITLLANTRRDEVIELDDGEE